MVAEAAAGPSQDEEARQASVQELQSLRESLSQAEAKTRELEGQLENVNKVTFRSYLICFLGNDIVGGEKDDINGEPVFSACMH